jgi:hypothetical protein
LNRDYNFVLLRDWFIGKVDEKLGLMLGIIVILWKMIHAVNSLTPIRASGGNKHSRPIGFLL